MTVEEFIELYDSRKGKLDDETKFSFFSKELQAEDIEQYGLDEIAHLIMEGYESEKDYRNAFKFIDLL
ncbi:MAG: hypothetical protein K9I94_11085 [Bacteroidales bacterium]|nr:hypothetical protein [Bacteroidales bacterium]